MNERDNQEAERAAPCPFCGADDSRIFEPDCGGYTVLCENCTAEGPLHETTTAAIAAWNCRHPAVGEAAPVRERRRVPESGTE